MNILYCLPCKKVVYPEQIKDTRGCTCPFCGRDAIYVVNHFFLERISFPESHNWSDIIFSVYEIIADELARIVARDELMRLDKPEYPGTDRIEEYADDILRQSALIAALSLINIWVDEKIQDEIIAEEMQSPSDLSNHVNCKWHLTPLNPWLNSSRVELTSEDVLRLTTDLVDYTQFKDAENIEGMKSRFIKVFGA